MWFLTSALYLAYMISYHLETPTSSLKFLGAGKRSDLTAEVTKALGLECPVLERVNMWCELQIVSQGTMEDKLPN